MSRTSSIMGGVGSKSRSLGQIVKKSCLRARGHIFDPIFLKLDQDIFLDNMDWTGSKSRSQGQILLSLGTTLAQSPWNLIFSVDRCSAILFLLFCRGYQVDENIRVERIKPSMRKINCNDFCETCRAYHCNWDLILQSVDIKCVCKRRYCNFSHGPYGLKCFCLG